MGARLLFFVACDDASIDQRTNKISVFSMLETGEITVSTEKETPIAIMPDFAAIACWYREGDIQESGFEQRMDLISPDGDILHPFPPQPFDLLSKRHRQYAKISGLPIENPKSGTYLFRLYLKEPGDKEEKRVFDYPIDIKVELITSEPSPEEP